MGLTLIITILVFILLAKLFMLWSDRIKFFTTGDDNGFKFSECRILWNLARMTELEDPSALFVSVPTLNRAITTLLTEARRKGIDNTPKIQNFLTKLYKFRTKINLDHQNRKGLDSTKYLDRGQRLRIIFPGHKGVFTSEILNNSYELIVRLPVQNGIATISGDKWINHPVSVYLWRKGDASYVFDTTVKNAGVFNGQTALFLEQTNTLLRAQKRKSVRCECNLTASMYFLKQPVTDYNLVEVEPGYKVVLEDISEDGAMIRVGGKGVRNAQTKLPFKINDILILMYGVVRAVEYNEEIKQSRLHFECLHLDTGMRNAILSFVYNVLPQEKKDLFDALTATEDDRALDETAPAEEPASGEENQPVLQAVPETKLEDKTVSDRLDRLAEMEVKEL